MPPSGDQISALDLEEELRRGDALTVVDVRPPAEFAEWHLSGSGARVVNVSAVAILRDPEGAVAEIGADAPVRIICAAGNASQRVVPLLRPRLPDVRNVVGVVDRVEQPEPALRPLARLVVPAERERAVDAGVEGVGAELGVG